MAFRKKKIQSDAGEIKSKEDIIERFRSACNETTQLEIEKLYASLPSHCKEIIFNTGLMFKYQFLKYIVYTVKLKKLQEIIF